MDGPSCQYRTNSDDDAEILTRTSWIDARVAHRQIEKGNAVGNVCALRLRIHLQRYLYLLGCTVQKHCGKVLFVGLLVLSLCCVGLKSAVIETDVKNLWVEDGGRLQKELQYTEKILGLGSGTTSELIIQTPHNNGLNSNNNILTAASFLLHLKAVKAATQVEVDLYGRTWKFRDICFVPSVPSFENNFFDRILDKLIPCVVISPLDCFWEGSKVLGEQGVYIPGYPEAMKWSNLHPRKMFETMKRSGFHFPSAAIEDALNRVGVTSGYQEKQCLNPFDPKCPISAPNKHSKKLPNIGAEVTNGCHGFAANYMHWQEDLILGGVKKNKTGHVVRAEALQTIVRLMGAKDMYDFYSDDYTIIHNIDWTQEKAEKVLETWQRKFTIAVNKVMNETTKDDVYSFSTVTLFDLINDFSQLSLVRVLFGYVLMLIYACISLLRWTDAIKSQSGIGVAGVLLVALSVAAGLGICSVLGITFNASTTQILPFLALGLGVDDIFLIAHTFAENTNKMDIPYSEQSGECLKRTGVSVLLTSISNACAFFMAAVIPIPALRAFSLQAALLILFNLASSLLIFPAIVSLDLIRQEEKRVDVFCCFVGSNANRVIELQPQNFQSSVGEDARRESPPPPYTVHQAVTHAAPGPGQHPHTVLVDPIPTISRWSTIGNIPHPPSLSASSSTTSSRHHLTGDDGMTLTERCSKTHQEICSWTLTAFAKNIYGPLLEKTPVKILVIVCFSLLLSISIFGMTKVEDGLDLTDIVPRHTTEYQFLSTQSKYFGFYQIFIVTKADFDYAKNQKLLYQHHKAFQRVSKIIKKEDGTLPDFWLEIFRQWVAGLQHSFDKDVARGCIVKDRWYSNASDEGVLGYKLMLQTGDLNNPTDKNNVMSNRLVREDIINEKAFYNYLTAWVSNDAMAYGSLQADFHPLPKPWYHLRDDLELKIPKAQPFAYAQTTFYLNDMGNTQNIVDTVTEIRSICEDFSERGLPNFPKGIPFTFWEQYINLRTYLMASLCFILGIIFIVLAVMLMNIWAAFIVVIVLVMIVVELFGFMGLTGIKMSAVPAVILIVSVGIGVEFTVHIVIGFVTAIGSRDRRMKISLHHTFAPIIHGAVSTLLGVMMLVGSEFDFIVRYFFNVMTVLVFIGLLNGLILLPVLLSIAGPLGEVQPHDNPNRISTPTPEPSPQPERRPGRATRSRPYPRMPSELSLSTISEEPSDYSSHEVVVHPEFIVETSTIPSRNNSRSNSRNPSPHSSPSPSRHVTHVKAIAKVKVEVHTQLPGKQEKNYKTKRRKTKELEASSSSSGDSDSSTNGKS
ncbi:protein patched homolog 1-like [Tubulanus polymorphus]|uniref:protein patched homolog 1-like n=1 Tax=Tubulanus polymorphus TaxID=672921 RepID=UPI003DA583D6